MIHSTYSYPCRSSPLILFLRIPLFSYGLHFQVNFRISLAFQKQAWWDFVWYWINLLIQYKNWHLCNIWFSHQRVRYVSPFSHISCISQIFTVLSTKRLHIFIKYISTHFNQLWYCCYCERQNNKIIFSILKNKYKSSCFSPSNSVVHWLIKLTMCSGVCS